jgi:hypothetical protein
MDRWDLVLLHPKLEQDEQIGAMLQGCHYPVALTSPGFPGRQTRAPHYLHSIRARQPAHCVEIFRQRLLLSLVARQPMSLLASSAWARRLRSSEKWAPRILGKDYVGCWSRRALILAFF